MVHLSLRNHRSSSEASSSNRRSFRRASRGFERLEPRLAPSGMGILPSQSTMPTAVFSTVPANGDSNPTASLSCLPVS